MCQTAPAQPPLEDAFYLFLCALLLARFGFHASSDTLLQDCGISTLDGLDQSVWPNVLLTVFLKTRAWRDPKVFRDKSLLNLTIV